MNILHNEVLEEVDQGGPLLLGDLPEVLVLLLPVSSIRLLDRRAEVALDLSEGRLDYTLQLKCRLRFAPDLVRKNLQSFVSGPRELSPNCTGMLLIDVPTEHTGNFFDWGFAQIAHPGRPDVFSLASNGLF